MRRILAVLVAILVSIIWLTMIVGLPVLAFTGMLDQVVPAEIRELVDLENFDRDRLAQLLEGDFSVLEPSPIDEPEVVFEDTPTPEPPTPLPDPPTETPTPEPTPAATPAPDLDLTATAEAADEITPAIEVTPTIDITVAQTVTVASIGNVRSGPGTDFDIVGTVDANATLQAVAQDATGEWFLLDDGTWIFGGLLVEEPDVPVANGLPVVTDVEATPTPDTPIADATPEPVTGVMTTANTGSNLRAGPGTTFEVVGGLAAGDPVTVVGRFDQDNWYLLATGNWIFGALLTAAPEDVPVVNAEGIIVSGPNAGQPVIPTAENPEAENSETENSEAENAETENAETETPAPIPAVPATANASANLRAGPGGNFAVVGSVTVGTRVTVVGRNQAGDWLRLSGGEWIFASVVDNPPANLPVVPDP